MDKSAVIRARISPETKHDVEEVFEKLGLSTSEAINVFCQQVIMNKGIPFEVKIPNEETQASFREMESRGKVARFNNVEEMFADLDI
jgi:DNA-damage-inducible protein J